MCQAAATYLAVAGIACAGTIVEASTNPVVSQISDGGLLNGGIAIAGVGAIAALAAILVSSDPSKRREQMSMDAGGDEMESVKNYFNTTGYDRWRKIYGETDDVNKVQLDIRTGHAQTVEKVLAWMRAEGNLKNCTVADCGCGTGSLAIPLALDGAAVHATDISSSMVGEAEMRYKALVADGAQAPEVAPRFEAMDLETASGKYHTVACLDVMIHYPQEKADDMITHLASLAEERVILSFAPKTLALSALKRVGEFFPGPSKATRAYLHREEDVEAALAKAGWKVTNREMTSTQFYYSRLLEAKRV
eukprot:CAMPEP_0196579586 /NCGR_PEP_ID=MMETSP1081-20130531/23143_1 /TAXON_ID=36882 /ORGANISM="Pyramimonas amylifera, Strain CCMP720" /LENGTH=305 /DNA_ID=CAMNT_0041899215 /DNA_START=260 /DNA_END=1177 /DNA_ORIENTATION=+